MPVMKNKKTETPVKGRIYLLDKKNFEKLCNEKKLALPLFNTVPSSALRGPAVVETILSVITFIFVDLIPTDALVEALSKKSAVLITQEDARDKIEYALTRMCDRLKIQLVNTAKTGLTLGGDIIRRSFDALVENSKVELNECAQHLNLEGKMISFDRDNIENVKRSKLPGQTVTSQRTLPVRKSVRGEGSIAGSVSHQDDFAEYERRNEEFEHAQEGYKDEVDGYKPTSDETDAQMLAEIQALQEIEGMRKYMDIKAMKMTELFAQITSLNADETPQIRGMIKHLNGEVLAVMSSLDTVLDALHKPRTYEAMKDVRRVILDKGNHNLSLLETLELSLKEVEQPQVDLPETEAKEMTDAELLEAGLYQEHDGDEDQKSEASDDKDSVKAEDEGLVKIEDTDHVWRSNDEEVGLPKYENVTVHDVNDEVTSSQEIATSVLGEPGTIITFTKSQIFMVHEAVFDKVSVMLSDIGFKKTGIARAPEQEKVKASIHGKFAMPTLEGIAVQSVDMILAFITEHIKINDKRNDAYILYAPQKLRGENKTANGPEDITPFGTARRYIEPVKMYYDEQPDQIRQGLGLNAAIENFGVSLTLMGVYTAEAYKRMGIQKKIELVNTPDGQMIVVRPF